MLCIRAARAPSPLRWPADCRCRSAVACSDVVNLVGAHYPFCSAGKASLDRYWSTYHHQSTSVDRRRQFRSKQTTTCVRHWPSIPRPLLVHDTGFAGVSHAWLWKRRGSWIRRPVVQSTDSAFPRTSREFGPASREKTRHPLREMAGEIGFMPTIKGKKRTRSDFIVRPSWSLRHRFTVDCCQEGASRNGSGYCERISRRRVPCESCGEGQSRADNQKGRWKKMEYTVCLCNWIVTKSCNTMLWRLAY